MYRRNLITLIMSILLLLALVQPVSAHSLQWGIALDDQFDYRADGVIYTTTAVHVDFYVTINFLETIPVLFTYWDIPRVGVISRYSDNDQSFDIGTEVSTTFGGFGLPAGDWNYLASVLSAENANPSSIWEYTVYENTTHWGYRGYATSASGETDWYKTYLKANGILTSYSVVQRNADSDITEQIEIIQILPVSTTTTSTTTSTTTTTTSTETSTTSTTSTTTPTITDNGQIMDIPLLVGIGVVVTIAASAGVFFKRRGLQDARVFVVCPYCGAKNEQGIFACQKCKADL